MNDSSSLDYWFLNITTIGSETVNCKSLLDTGGASMNFNTAVGPALYTAMGLSADQIDYCTSGNTPCIPENLAGNTMPFTFDGSSAIFQVAGADNSSCQNGYCDSTFSLTPNNGPNNAYLGVAFLSVGVLL